MDLAFLLGLAKTVKDIVDKLKEQGLNASFDEKNQRMFISSAETGENYDFTLESEDENGKKEYIGKLKEYDDFKIIVEQDENEIQIERKNISQIKTVYNW